MGHHWGHTLLPHAREMTVAATQETMRATSSEREIMAASRESRDEVIKMKLQRNQFSTDEAVEMKPTMKFDDLNLGDDD